jgi:hypothetical protein
MRNRVYLILLFCGALLLVLISQNIIQNRQPTETFSGQRAYQDVLTQIEFGPRTVGSEAHAQTLTWIAKELKIAGWDTEIQETVSLGHTIRNLIASRDEKPVEILLGSHYDSRNVADRDTGTGTPGPVPGANDGASSVAVLLELARTLPRDTVPVWLVFFDAEDNGNLPGWDWILGSRAFVSLMPTHPQLVIIVDMVGDADLNIYQERSSTPELVESIWKQAAALGYEGQFIPNNKYSMLDDHTPFLEAGIPAALIIDFNYPYWHTSADTIDKVAPESLEVVGRTLWAWITAHE